MDEKQRFFDLFLCEWEYSVTVQIQEPRTLELFLEYSYVVK